MSTHINKRQSLISSSFLSLKEKNLRLTLSKRKLEAIEARLDEDSSRSFFISESWLESVEDQALVMMMNDMISFSFLKNTTRLLKNDSYNDDEDDSDDDNSDES